MCSPLRTAPGHLTGRLGRDGNSTLTLQASQNSNDRRGPRQPTASYLAKGRALGSTCSPTSAGSKVTFTDSESSTHQLNTSSR